MNQAGFFRELRHGISSGPSLQECVQKLPESLVPGVLEYLRNGSVLAATGQRSRDWFKPEVDSGPMDIFTDGVWVWPGDLSYYVENYHVELPEDFVFQMREKGWQCPSLNDTQLLDAEAKFFASS